MPSNAPLDSDSDGDEAFLSRFARSEESSEFYSPIPEGYVKGRTKYVVVFGTVMSGLGKGIFSARPWPSC